MLPLWTKKILNRKLEICNCRFENLIFRQEMIIYRKYDIYNWKISDSDLK